MSYFSDGVRQIGSGDIGNINPGTGKFTDLMADNLDGILGADTARDAFIAALATTGTVQLANGQVIKLLSVAGNSFIAATSAGVVQIDGKTGIEQFINGILQYSLDGSGNAIFRGPEVKILNADPDTHLSISNSGPNGDDWQIVSAGNSNDAISSRSLLFKNMDTGIVGPQIRSDGIINLSAHGAFFGATGDANLLDDYEQGIFTPVIADAIIGGNVGTATTSEGFYTKVGRLVTAHIGISNVGTVGLTPTNNFHIRGLPFVSHPDNESRSVGPVAGRDVTLNGVHTVAFMEPNAAALTLLQIFSAAGWSQVPVSGVQNGNADFFITISYITA